MILELQARSRRATPSRRSPSAMTTIPCKTPPAPSRPWALAATKSQPPSRAAPNRTRAPSYATRSSTWEVRHDLEAPTSTRPSASWTRASYPRTHAPSRACVPSRWMTIWGKAASRTTSPCSSKPRACVASPLDHLLFSGPPGLGKTTLASVVANEMGGADTHDLRPRHRSRGRSCGHPHQSRGRRHPLHRRDTSVSTVRSKEVLYPAMEDYAI